MTARSARLHDGRRPARDFDDAPGGLADFLLRNRTAVGSLMAFAVAFAYVGANALWYQPHAHSGPFFATRPATAAMPQPDRMGSGTEAPADAAAVETIIRIERERLAARDGASATQPAPSPTPAPVQRVGDPVVEEVQRILAGLNLYSGSVDGLTGPQTRTAIEAYRKMVGLSVSAEIDDQLLTQLGARQRGTPTNWVGTDMIETASAPAREDDAMTRRIQAGLRAFGNDGIEIDGVVGSRTRAAIREFQSLFGLAETGEPDAAVYAKMRDIGLAD